jgi:hypothetical protein
VVRFDDLEGKPVAVLVNFAAHPVLTNTKVLKYSADYPGFLKNKVEAELATRCVFMQGAGGDMSANVGDGPRGPTGFGETLADRVIALARAAANPGRDAAGDAVQPAGGRAAAPDRAGLAREDEEDGLRGVFGVGAVAQHLATDAQDHRRVAFDQDAERRLGRFVAQTREARDQRRVVGLADRPGAPERLQLPRDRPVRHPTISRPPLPRVSPGEVSRRDASGSTFFRVLDGRGWIEWIPSRPGPMVQIGRSALEASQVIARGNNDPEDPVHPVKTLVSSPAPLAAGLADRPAA